MTFLRIPIAILTIWFCSICELRAQQFERDEIRDAVERKAVCNDGSPGGYYFRPGTGNGKYRWVIQLECGGFCTSTYCGGTSINQPPTLDGIQNGLFSAKECQNPDFYNANQVFLRNCSGDLWSGNNSVQSTAGPIEYRGRNIFRSTIQDLIDTPGSTLGKPGTEILLWGPSCGGIGVMANLDWLSERLPGAKVRGLNDAGWLFRTACCNYDYDGRREDLRRAVQIWKPELNESCASAHPDDLTECLFPSVYPYLKTPLFVQFPQWDWHFVSPGSPEREEFARDVRRSLDTVPAAFSSQYSTYAVGYRREFASLKVNDYSMADLLGNWFFDRAGPVKQISTTPNPITTFTCPEKRGS